VSQVYQTPPLDGYQLAPNQAQAINVFYNQALQTLTVHYVPITSSIMVFFVDDVGHEVYSPVNLEGRYGELYSVVPNVPWTDQLTYASQTRITGSFGIGKQVITVYYTRLEAQLTVQAMDDWGNLLTTLHYRGYLGDTYTVNMPSYWYLKIENPAYQKFSGTYLQQNNEMYIIYDHIPAVLHVNVNVEGQTTWSQDFDGFLNVPYGFPIASYSAYYLTPNPGPSWISGTFTSTWSVQNYNYYYVRSTITITYVGSDGTYLGSETFSGIAGQGFGFTFARDMGRFTLPYPSSLSGTYTGYNQNFVIRYSTTKTDYYRYGRAVFNDPTNLYGDELTAYNNFWGNVYGWEGVAYQPTINTLGPYLPSDPRSPDYLKWYAEEQKKKALEKLKGLSQANKGAYFGMGSNNNSGTSNSGMGSNDAWMYGEIAAGTLALAGILAILKNKKKTPIMPSEPTAAGNNLDIQKMKDIARSGGLAKEIVTAELSQDTISKVLKEVGNAKRVRGIRMGAYSNSETSLSRMANRGSALKSVGDDLTDLGGAVAKSKVLKVAGAAGTLLSVGLDYDEQMSKYHDQGRAITNTAAHAALGAGGTAVGTYIGGVLGTAIPIPGVGTVLGAAAGAVIGTAASATYDWIESGQAGKDLANVGKKVNKIISGVGKALGGIFG
jgi:hypothetical protein